MALMLARPRYLPLRINHVETERDGSKPMFMSLSWGLLADIGTFHFIQIHLSAKKLLYTVICQLFLS